jgi:transcriptional regulator with XRE-family HTH domain
MSNSELLKTITDKLIKVQTALGISDSKFAKKIGISTNMWCKIRRGERGMGGGTLLKAFQAFPALQVMRDGKDRDLEITIKV